MRDAAERLRQALADRYPIDRELGRGGMGTVYLARDLRHHRKVAVKVLLPDLAASLGAERFLREIEIGAQLQHPHILPLHDSGDVDGVLYYIMPFVEGESLRERLDREKQLPVDVALALAREVADALAYAHAQGVIHRDVKPENILLSGGHAVVADFGIARAVDVARASPITGAGLALGTPAYMSPEQAAGVADIDGRSDLYSLGCVLYEMLAGAPPFSAPTPQAVIARHLHDPPPPLRTVRSAVPADIERVLMKALAKAPGDRYATGAEFAAALLEPSTAPRVGAPRRSRRRRYGVALASAAGLGGVAAIWALVVAPAPAPHARRIVVYPLAVTGADPGTSRIGEPAFFALVNALNGSGYLTAVDGWPLLPDRARNDPRALSGRSARSVARDQRAAHYVRWSALATDSVRLVLELHDVAGDSATFQRILTFPREFDGWTMGLRATEALLPALILPGRAIDLSSLSDRNPTAIASFLQGEHAYRRAHFREAFEHYRSAVANDSAFALAALRGAVAARWNKLTTEARALTDVALREREHLAPRYTWFARGLNAFLSSQADSAVEYFRLALKLDPEWTEAWMELGEVFTHLLPRDAPLDSLAAAAFEEVRRRDPAFAPVLYHLIEIAIRKGDVRGAQALVRQFREVSPDSIELIPAELIVRCVGGSRGAVDWRDAVRKHPDQVVEAAMSLTVAGLRQPDCARAGWRAVLDYDTATNRRWGALKGLQSVLVAQGRLDEVRVLLNDSTTASPNQRLALFILDAVAGAKLGQEAAAAGALLQEAYRSDPSLGTSRLWYAGVWGARQREAVARRLADSVAARAGRTGAQVDSLVWRSLTALAAAAAADTGRAIALLAGLRPTGRRELLQWDPWQSLGPERLALAELRLARGEAAEAFRIASNFDAPAPVPYAAFVPASLVIRIRAARALGRNDVARRLEQRLRALQRGARVDPDR